jgi:hypothetical protein
VIQSRETWGWVRIRIGGWKLKTAGCRIAWEVHSWRESWLFRPSIVLVVQDSDGLMQSLEIYRFVNLSEQVLV